MAVISGQRMYYVHSMHERYGYYVRLSPNEVSVADPTGFQHIHRINSGFNKTQWYQDAVLFPRQTIFTMNEPKQHAERRRLLSRAFSKSYLRQHCEATVKQIIERAVAQIACRGHDGPVDILQWWTFMATDVSAKLNFGESFNMVDYGQVCSCYLVLESLLKETTKVNHYIQVLQSALQGGGIGAEMPLVRIIGSFIPLTACQNLFRAGPFLIQYAKEALAKAKKSSDVPSLFQGIIEEAKSNRGLDELDMQLEATGLIVAGSDTTAVTLTYLVWAVLNKPELLKQIQDEVGTLREGYTDNDVEGLPIVNAVIEETLRLYGAAPGALPRYVPPGGVELGGYYFPEKVTLTTQAYTLHRDPAIFPDPYR